MNMLRNNNIPSMHDDETLLTTVTKQVCADIRNKYLCEMPDTWDFECGCKKLTFKEIREKYIAEGISYQKAEEYFGIDSSIETDAHVIYITIYNGNTLIKKPIFMGEMKKQGTNDKRIAEGKKKQAIGNAGPDRVCKNFEIASEFCYLCDKEFFPYNVFLHGCDFGEDEITKTAKAKLTPFFGKLNNFNPYFDKDIFWARKGGSCFYQKKDFTHEELYEWCYKCCETGIKHYLRKYGNN